MSAHVYTLVTQYFPEQEPVVLAETVLPEEYLDGEEGTNKTHGLFVCLIDGSTSAV